MLYEHKTEKPNRIIACEAYDECSSKYINLMKKEEEGEEKF